MQVSDKGVAFLVAHEGIVPGPYLDGVGVWTFGIGHTAAAGAPIPKDLPRGMCRSSSIGSSVVRLNRPGRSFVTPKLRPETLPPKAVRWR
ncbi:hypothetical protein [Paracoccus sp. (in: a-proteobacteria)]|uniref:hypothetical protein n=1 Tax=Paracoccus sp. TaxID=267 RepID=UPI0039E4029C